jgi:hypothetical protein
MAIANRKNIVTLGFDEDALTAGEHLINFGGLTTIGELADGIFADADDAKIQNFGTIETSGLGARGIFVDARRRALKIMVPLSHTVTFSTRPISFRMVSLPRETSSISPTTAVFASRAFSRPHWLELATAASSLTTVGQTAVRSVQPPLPLSVTDRAQSMPGTSQSAASSLRP